MKSLIWPISRIALGLVFVFASGIGLSYLAGWWFSFTVDQRSDLYAMDAIFSGLLAIVFLCFEKLQIREYLEYFYATTVPYFIGSVLLEVGVGHTLWLFGSRRGGVIVTLLAAIVVGGGYWFIAGRHAGLWHLNRDEQEQSAGTEK